MRFLRRGSGDDANLRVPEWASYFTPQQFDRFMTLVRTWIRANTREFHEVDGGGVDVVFPDGKSNTLGLANLGQKCLPADSGEWPGIIEGHFKSLTDAQATDDLSFDQARSMIKTRLYPEDYASAPIDPEKGPISEVIAPGLRRMLALDLPTVVKSIGGSDAKRWGIPLDELWALGLANVRAHDVPEVAHLDDGAVMLSSESFFVATWALMLERYLDPVPQHGAVLVVPNRHTLVFRPVIDLSVVPSCRSMVVFGEEMFREGPGSITPNLYWWRAGSLTLLPAELANGKVNFMPPDEFVAVLNSLAPAGEQG